MITSRTYLLNLKFLLLLLPLLFHPAIIFPDCSSNDLFFDNCARNLNEYTFLKSYQFDQSQLKKLGLRPTVKYSSIFSKGSEYFFSVCNENRTDNNKMIIKLYDSNERLITSTYDPVFNRYFSKFKFPCRRTGVYYIEFSFQGALDGCGAGMVGIKM